jgi:hypothetical protein
LLLRKYLSQFMLLPVIRTHLKLNPGQRGTKKLLAEYGDRLVCVRYRYNEAQKKRFKTVELIVEAIAWRPKVRHMAADPTFRTASCILVDIQR